MFCIRTESSRYSMPSTCKVNMTINLRKTSCTQGLERVEIHWLKQYKIWRLKQVCKGISLITHLELLKPVICLAKMYMNNVLLSKKVMWVCIFGQPENSDSKLCDGAVAVQSHVPFINMNKHMAGQVFEVGYHINMLWWRINSIMRAINQMSVFIYEQYGKH